MSRALLPLFCTLLITTQAHSQFKFGDSYSDTLEAGKKDKKLILFYLADEKSANCKSMDKDFAGNARLWEPLGKKIVAARLLAEGNKDAFTRFEARNTPTFIVLDSQGNQLAREEGYLPPARFSAWIDSMTELQAGLAAFEKIDKTKPAPIVAALRKIGAVITDKSYSVLLEAAENEELPDAARKVAIEGLGKQKFGPEKLLNYVTHKNATLKAAAISTLKLQGQAATGALIEGVASENVDVRVACAPLLAAQVRNPKLAKDPSFWKNGKSEDRDKAVAALRDWHTPPKRD